ncbi:MAG TPA: CDP-alcohol phosphatidyltransferase family protein [Terriglobia bacterium]|nr:CDP-alcohol phosphatidyltransferase family protein [Terriglobia bacterium]
MSERTFTIPNQVSLLRLIFVPFFTLVTLDGRYDWAFVLAMLAATSDFVDGWIARTFHQQSVLGVALDPVADKVLMGAAYIVMSLCGLLPWWLTSLVVLRDGGILAGALLVILFAGYRPLPPTYAGKASTVGQFAAVAAAIGWKAQFPLMSVTVVEACIYLAGALTIISGMHYLITWRQRIVRRPGSQLS